MTRTHRVAFEKWHGLGNDFIVVDRDTIGMDAAREKAIALCDRHFGVGADGLLVVGPGPRMHVINADGSEPEMCGNGIRCVVSWWVERQGLPAEGVIAVDTDAGVRACRYTKRGDGAYEVEVDMGHVSMSPADAGVNALLLDAESSIATLRVANLGEGVIASTGNPHWVFAGGDETTFRTMAPQLEHDPRFAHRTNVEWATPVGPQRFRVVVWERGVGFTLACGTGATATAGVLVALGQAELNVPVAIELPGGDLSIVIDDDGDGHMTGPARRVYRGTLQLT